MASIAKHARKCVTLLDGGMGEELFRRGLPDDRKTWSAKALSDEQYHGLVKEAHKAFIQAGSKFITANNYAVTPACFEEPDIVRLTALAGRLAREAATSEVRAVNDVKVLGSLPPLVESYRPDLIKDHDEGVRVYKLICTSLDPFVDGYIAETLSSCDEMRQAIDAVAETKKEKDLFCSWTLNSQGQLRSGEQASEAVRWVVEYCKERGCNLQGVLFNCSQPESIDKAFADLSASHSVALLDANSIRLGAYANRLPEVNSAWTMESSTEAAPLRQDLSPEVYFSFILRWVNHGCELIGGCCGITPEHIKFIGDQLNLPTTPPTS